MTIPRELPTDLLEEILVRVPATSLKRLRSTCKLWNRLFGDKNFTRSHSEKAAKQFLVLMLTNEFTICAISVNLHHGKVPSVKVKGELSLLDSHSAKTDISQVFHCDGLLLCSLKEQSRIVVWNPFTGETKWINAEKYYENDRSFVLGYYQDKKSRNKSYKILSFSRGNNVSEIYEFNSDSWRVLDDDIASGWFIGSSGQSVSLKGKAYLFAVDQTKTNQEDISLLRFDFSTERYRSVTLPYDQYSYSYETANLSVVREEKLSVLLQRESTTKTEIWVTNKIDDGTKVVTWSKVLALDLSSDLQISDFGSFLLDEEKKVLVCCEKWINNMEMEDEEEEEEEETEAIERIYIVGEDNKVIQKDFGVGLETIDGSWPVILNYVPSLVRIQQAGSKRKRGD